MLNKDALNKTIDMLISERQRIEARSKELSQLPFGVVDTAEEDYLKFEAKDLQDAINALEHLVDSYCDNRVFSTQNG